jgi:hypothetical protein
VDMVGVQVSFIDPALLLLGQFAEDPAQMLP